VSYPVCDAATLYIMRSEYEREELNNQLARLASKLEIRPKSESAE